MRNIAISDATLRLGGIRGEARFGFREKTEILRQLEKLQIDCIELSPLAGEEDEKTRRTDILFIRTAARLCGKSVLSVPAGMTASEADAAYAAVKEAAHPRLHVILPTSPVQMEYTCHRKPAAMLTLVQQQVAYCASLCADVEFTAEDATRAEPAFLADVLRTAAEAGATTLTLCDSAGGQLPGEFAAFVEQIRKELSAYKTPIRLQVECCDDLSMGVACAIAALSAGADGVRTTVGRCGLPTLPEVAHVLQVRGTSLGIGAHLLTTGLRRAVGQMQWITGGSEEPEDGTKRTGAVSEEENAVLEADCEMADVRSAVEKLGYDLGEEDMKKVYDAFRQAASERHRPIGMRELDVIVAGAALQVPPTYRLCGYHVTTTGVPDSGGVSVATAQVVLEKNGQKMRGLASGEGPVDAALRAIEQAACCHYELDHFRIESVTEGREALGSSLVRLRADGRLYAGVGLSSDIVAAGIRAYLGALNKIVYEEGGAAV